MNTTPENLIVAAMIDKILADVRVELIKATAKHGPFPTCHHGHSVILEELEELFDEIRADRGQLGPARREALQIACVAVRYVLDLCTTESEFDAIAKAQEARNRPRIEYDPSRHMLPSQAIDSIRARNKRKRKKRQA